ncbi:MAG: FtsH protease activity modulator HflK [Gammaproteobacteria bacterium]|nr:FtsH protease activity modulator HflK [Gammaproteobacteria bacterium]
MAWNQPGGNGDNKDPWGGGKRNPGPPDIDKILSEFISKLRSLFHFKPKIPGTGWQPSHSKEVGFTLGLVVFVALIAWCLSGLFIVNPAEQTVILRFGKYSDTLNPGLHWMARFIDTKYTVDVQKIYSFAIQSDFLTKSSEQGDLPNQLIPDSQATKENAAATLAPDASDKSKNLVNVEMTVQYRVSNAEQYLFNVANPDETIKEVASGTLSDIVGKMKLDDVLTTGREFLSAGVLERIKAVLATYNPGLEVVAVTLRKVQAPDQVQAAFNDVNRADQDKSTYVQQAQAYASKVVPLAQGIAARTLADANAYEQQAVLTAQAQVAKFQALLDVYKTSPELTRQRIYLETMQTIFTNTSKVLIDTNGGNNVIYLPLDKMVQSANQNPVSLEDNDNLQIPNIVNAAAPATVLSSNPMPSNPVVTEVKQ